MIFKNSSDAQSIARISFNKIHKRKMNQPKATKPTALRLPKNTIGTVNPRSSNEGYSAEFYGNKSNEGVDFSSLIRFIKKVSTNPQCIFNWKDFERAPTVQTYSTRDGEGGTIQRMKIINNNIPFTYKDEYGKTNTSFLQARLNKRIDAIDYDWGFSIQIDAKSKLIFAQLSLYYVNTAKFRNKVTATPNPNDFTVNDQYRGIVFQSENLTDFAYLVNAIDPSQFEFIKNKIKTKFVDAIQKAKNEDEIVFLFENAPYWIAENFKSDKLINYLKTILSYDIEGWFSGYVDGSCAFINVLRGFNTLDKWVDLYHFFKENPEFVKKAYHGLDSTSIWEGVKQTNKTIFASFLTSLSYAVMDSEKVAIEPPTKTFYLGDGYTINTSALGALDFNDTQYFLKQERTKLVGMIPIANSWFYPVTYDEDLEEGAYYNPLQMVQVYNVAQKTAMVVPAIFLHDTASRDELAQIMKAVRIGVNVFTIAVSIASLGSASPLVALAAAADITLATADTIFALAEDQLSKEFVETWSKIYLVGGAATAGPVLLNSVFKGGMKILNGTAKAEFKNFVRAFIFKVVMEIKIANFTKSTIKEILFVEQTIIADGIRIEFSEITRLQNAGATFIKGIGFDGKVRAYAVIYKGAEIADGTAKEIREVLKDAWNLSGSKLIEELEKLRFSPRLSQDGKTWICLNEYGTKLKWANETNAEMFAKIEKQIEEGQKAEKLMNDRGAIFSQMNQKQQQLLTAGLEAEVAKEFSKYDNLLSVTNPVYKGKIKAGEFDGLLSKYLVEVKYSVSGTTKTGEFLDQFKKYINPLDQNFINVQKKPVVLFIKQFTKGGSIDQSVLRTLQKSKEIKVIIITDFKQIKNLY
ncbi:hypothetical protein FLACOL_01163 [Flavobacterium columnare]|uniref:Uncharacterized protein n=2 Tax=Flavobacterium columnare TaxID=996 RepID=A0A2N9PA25_9FLAO|nr:hypothetical protein FLACOL_01163 [Flavobacterium columnare]